METKKSTPFFFGYKNLVFLYGYRLQNKNTENFQNLNLTNCIDNQLYF